MTIANNTSTRAGFNSPLGFIFAAAGSAIGLGNIWAFPTNAANHGGGAFLLVYLIVTLLLALPALYAEIYLGNQTQTNPVAALGIACQKYSNKLGRSIGMFGLVGAIVMLSFYTIVAGWMFAHALSSLADLFELSSIAKWLTTDSISRNLVFTPIFIFLAAAIIIGGINKGIEKWSKRLMPLFIIMLMLLIIYILQQDGAAQGVKKYLVPDFAQLTNANLIISAMGQAFFSLSLGVGGMMIYGSYIPKGQNLGKLVISIAALDTLIAFLAGLLIIPALYVAMHIGQNVLDNGNLIGEGQLIFYILPNLFQTLGTTGLVIGCVFFTLLSIAALTSTISSTEVPVAYLVEEQHFSRPKATYLVSLVIFICSCLIIVNFEYVFTLAITLLTTFIQPISSLCYFIIIAWLWQQGNRLHTLHVKFAATAKKPSNSIIYLRYYLGIVCPLLLTVVFLHRFFT